MPQGKVWAVLALLCIAVLFGGGTRAGFLGDAVIQLGAVVALGAMAVSWSAQTHDVGWRLAWPAFALIALPALQLLPLPPQIWSGLSTHVAVSEGLTIAGFLVLPWWTWSIAPTQTIQSLNAALPVVAVFMAVASLDRRNRRFVSLAIIGLGCLNVLLGLAQVAQGPGSALRFFEITNLSEAVGTFANRNHYAALLYVTLIFAAAWLVSPLETLRGLQGYRFDTSIVMVLATLFLVIFFSLSGQLMARSRAGLGLTMAALLGSYAILSVSELRRDRAGGRIMLAALVLAVVLATQFALYRMLERFDSDPLSDARISIAQTTFKIASSALPFGTGMGTFQPAFAASETVAGTFASYVNRAHNDLLELALEAGVPGLALLGGFLIWYCVRLVQTWRASSTGDDVIDVTLMRAATLVVLLLLCHSLVDYPLRTSAMACVFAASCALMTQPRARHVGLKGAASTTDTISPAQPRPARKAVPYHLQSASRPGVAEPSSLLPVPSARKPETETRNAWQPDQDWPDGWQSTSEPPRTKKDDK